MVGVFSSEILKRTFVSGGTLSSDSTYYYRTFTSSGNLVISGENLPVEYLVIGGGGGGGQGNISSGGGGGAGGVRSASATLTSNTYVALVGAGHPMFNYDGSPESSSFNSLIATAGGKGAGGNATAAGSGGSGGGSNNSYPTVGISSPVTSPVQGNSGGTTQSGSTGGGGGGGAAGAGGYAQGGYGGTGGHGTAAYHDWAVATGTGTNQNYSGTSPGANTLLTLDYYYYGGGGGGGTHVEAYILPGGNGGGGTGYYVTADGTNNVNYPYTIQNGKVNTGGGAGGQGFSSGYSWNNNSSGGSGLVIVRYLKSAVD